MDLHKIAMKVSMQLYGNGALNRCIVVWILSNYVFMMQSLTAYEYGSWVLHIKIVLYIER